MAAATRVIQWSTYRSLSYAFARSMMTIDSIKMFFEPFCESYFFGTDRVSDRCKDRPPIEGATYNDIKALLEGEFEGASCVFVKGISTHFHGVPNVLDFIPEGYIHTFLIRDPRYFLPSMYECQVKHPTEWKYFDPAEAGVDDLWRIYNLLKDKYGEENLMIIDTEDLLDEPELILREYCRRTGLPYNDKMVEWGDEKPKFAFGQAGWETWSETATNSKGLKKRHRKNRCYLEYPEVVINEVERSLEFYHNLYKLRYQPSSDKTKNSGE